MDPKAILATFGHAYNENRFVSVIYIVLPLIGLLERHGLQERARGLIATLHGATVGRLLTVYLLFRQITAALGLLSIAGHAQTVRPLVAPMAEGAAEGQKPLDDEDRNRLRALAAGTDNIGVFFGEDIFLAVGSILLMKGFLDQYGVVIEPLTLSMWAIPSALCAFVVHATRLFLLDRRLKAGGRP
jgi:uncharacterized membrane protein